MFYSALLDTLFGFSLLSFLILGNFYMAFRAQEESKSQAKVIQLKTSKLLRKAA